MAIMDIMETVSKIGMFFIPFLLSLSFHEYAHGFVANLRGDPTAKMMGRLTMNPFAHADLIGTIILPMLAVMTSIPFFGWAKPVPINERNLRNPRTDVFWVALAGPASNLLLATLGVGIMSLVYHQFFDNPEYFNMARAAMSFGAYFVLINLGLAFFNFIPVHPLDGGKIIARFLPYSVNQSLERAQPILNILLLVLFLTSALQQFLWVPIRLALGFLSVVFHLPVGVWGSLL